MIYTIDLEFRQTDASVYCAAIYGNRAAHVFDTVGELVDFIFTLPSNTIIYSHYGGGSDFLFILREIVGRSEAWLSSREFFQSGSRIVAFTVCYRGRKYQFRDSYAIMPASLNKLSRSFLGREKLEDSSRLDDLPLARIKEQCLNDARLLHDCIRYFSKAVNCEILPLTIASLALQEMSSLCDMSKLIDQSDEEYELFRPWYFGGHVDVYRRYAESIYQYDINSAYPTVMRNWGCPVGRPRPVLKFDENKCGLYVIRTNAKFFNPFLCQRLKQLYFVNGSAEFYVTDLDIRKLIEHKCEFKVLYGYEWNYDEDFFKLFVDKWYGYRGKGEAENLVGKLILNSGYGKFGINRDRDVVVFGKDADYYLTTDFDIGVKKVRMTFWYSHVEVAARITAGARLLLFEAQNSVGSSSLVYSDTDSVFTTDKINERDGLGGLKFVEKYQRGYFLGNKFYGLVKSNGSFKCVLKGFPERFSECQFMQGLRGELTFKTASRQLMKFRSALKRMNDFVAVREFLKEVKTVEIKRKINKDGIHTRPFYFNGHKLF